MGYTKGLLITALVIAVCMLGMVWENRSHIEHQNKVLKYEIERLKKNVAHLSKRLPASQVMLVSVRDEPGGEMMDCLFKESEGGIKRAHFREPHVTLDSCSFDIFSVRDTAQVWCPLAAKDVVEKCVAKLTR